MATCVLRVYVFDVKCNWAPNDVRVLVGKLSRELLSHYHALLLELLRRWMTTKVETESVYVGERYSQYLWALTSPQSFPGVQLVVWQLFRHCLNIPALCERVRAYKAHLARCKQTDCGCVCSLLFSRSPEQYVNCATRVYHNILYPETLWLYNTSCAVWKTCVLISRRFLRRPSS